jgi:DNA-binding SARP family transcriptional activator
VPLADAMARRSVAPIVRADTVMTHQPAHPPALVISLFGPLVIREGRRSLGDRDLGGARPKQVLEILLAARGHRVPIDRLADLLWGERLPQDPAAALQTFVSVLRRRLSPDRRRARELVVTEPDAYRFAVELVDLDLDRFDQLLERSGQAATRDARPLLEEALALVRGEVLEDEPYASWAEDLRGTYRGRALGAHLDAAEAALAECDYAAALTHARAAIGLDRFAERAHRTTMLALYAMGRAHEALDAYRRVRELLASELGLDPTAETRGLENAILRQEDVCSLLPRPVGEQATSPPGGSLRLLGRREELRALTDAVRRSLEGEFALVMVEGEGGVGKSRLLNELTASLRDVRVGRATCSPLERDLPYVPLAAALRDALGDVEVDPARPALAGILPELGAGRQGADVAPLDALEALVGFVAQHAPLVLVLDDLQWADPTTIAAVGYLQRRCARLPAAVVVALRSEDAPPHHPLHRLSPTAAVRLEPLTPTELAPLGMPELHGATGGHPHFVADAIANGTRRELSAALAEMLLSRCRMEGPDAHRVLASAAALEQPFEPELLAEMLCVDPAELTEELERLRDRRLLRASGLRFRFRYDLVRHALVQDLSPARRRLLTQRAAEARRALRRTAVESAAAG